RPRASVVQELSAPRVQQWEQAAVELGLRQPAYLVRHPMLRKPLARPLPGVVVPEDPCHAVPPQALDEFRHGCLWAEARPHLIHEVQHDTVALGMRNGKSHAVWTATGRIREGYIGDSRDRGQLARPGFGIGVDQV